MRTLFLATTAVAMMAAPSVYAQSDMYISPGSGTVSSPSTKGLEKSTNPDCAAGQAAGTASCNNDNDNARSGRSSTSGGPNNNSNQGGSDNDGQSDN